MSGNFFGALAQIIHFAIQVYIFIIIIRSVASWMGNVSPIIIILGLFLVDRLVTGLLSDFAIQF
jgi:uncharacterized protein YggT (Ycf19 family)